jgi:hypothetical protein
MSQKGHLQTESDWPCRHPRPLRRSQMPELRLALDVARGKTTRGEMADMVASATFMP